MRVVIDRNTCGHHPAGCEQCFGEFLRHGDVPDRGCIVDVQEDGQPEVTAFIKSGDFESKLVVTEENRENIIYDGYMKYIDLPPEAFEIQPPHGSDVRRMLKERERAKQKDQPSAPTD